MLIHLLMDAMRSIEMKEQKNASVRPRHRHAQAGPQSDAHQNAVWNSHGCRGRGISDIMQLMGTRMARVAAMIVLLICVVCPVTEMFDNWDHTLQTGQDTEYTLC